MTKKAEKIIDPLADLVPDWAGKDADGNIRAIDTYAGEVIEVTEVPDPTSIEE